MLETPSVDLLSANIYAALYQGFLTNAFSKGEDISVWLAGRGCQITEAAVPDDHQDLRARVSSAHAYADAVTDIVRAAPDDCDYRSAAAISMVQSEILALLASLCDVPKSEGDGAFLTRARLLTQVSRAISDLSRASIAQKKFATEVRLKLDELMRDAKAGRSTLDAATIAHIKSAVYGIE